MILVHSFSGNEPGGGASSSRPASINVSSSWIALTAFSGLMAETACNSASTLRRWATRSVKGAHPQIGTAATPRRFPIMFMGSVIEDSFNIAWGLLERSGQLSNAETSTDFRFIEDQIRSGERRPMMIANRAIDAYQGKAPQPVSVESGSVVWIA